MENANSEKLKQIADFKQQLSHIKDIDILLENILTIARKITNADAGSIYDYNDSNQILKIRYSQNDTKQKRLGPGEKLPYVSFSMKATPTSISGYCALNKVSVNIPDVYNMAKYIEVNGKKELRPYSFNKTSDLCTSYKTHSILTMPLFITSGKVLGVIQIINAMDSSGKVVPFTEDDEFYISYFASNIMQIYEYAYFTKQLIERLVKMANYRDPRETGAHVERVSSFALEIYDRYASNLKISEQERNKFRDNLKLAAKCHDVGKISIPDCILKKNGKLDDDERAIMKGHACIGAQIFTPLESELDEMARDVCLHHHDRWDGGSSGYPKNYDYMSYVAETKMPYNMEQKYSGNDIPLAARIVAIADVYDALRHIRCYKGEWTLEQTLEEIKSEAGHQFDPDLVTAFLQVIDRLEAINAAIS